MNWKHRKNRRSSLPPRRPSLRFSPYAWAKLIYFRDRGETEIGGFGLAAEDDPLLIVDFLTVKQRTTVVTVAFDDAAVADLYDEMVDGGVPLDRFSRLWIHTHPGGCPLPSATDEATFRRVFGKTDWAVMAILARGGASYARLAFHVGPGGSLQIPMRVDYERSFDGTDWGSWCAEFSQNVLPVPPPHLDVRSSHGSSTEQELTEFWNWDTYDRWTEKCSIDLNDRKS